MDTERVEMMEAALGALGKEESAVRARLLINLACELCFAPEHERRHVLAREALALARRLGDPSTLAYVLIMSYWPLDHLEPAELEERRRELAAAGVRDLRRLDCPGRVATRVIDR